MPHTGFANAHTRTHTLREIEREIHRDATQRSLRLESFDIFYFFYTHRLSPRCDSAELSLVKIFFFIDIFLIHAGIHRDATQQSCAWKSFTPTNPGNFLIAICVIGVFM
jgi:hypothetical protein